MTERHPLDLILGHEGLEGEDRRRADAHLEACTDCRRLLEECRRVEAEAAAAAGVLQAAEAGTDPLTGLDEAVRDHARTSRDGLLARLPAGTVSVAWWRRGGTAVGLVAAAAVLAMAFFFGSVGEGDVPFDGLRLAPAVVMRDAAVDLAPGDAVSLRFEPRRDGWPVVVRVDDTGAQLLCPAPGQAGWQVRVGLPAVIPPPGSGTAWRHVDGAGWLVALTADPVPDPVALAASVAAAEDVRQLLERRFGAVGSVLDR